MEPETPGLVEAIRIDLVRLHETWMELVFPRQLNPSQVLGKWSPKTTPQQVAYYGWATLGIPLVALGYPLLLLGFTTRYYAARLDSAGARLGILGVVGVSLLAWGVLTAAAWLRNFSASGMVAVVAASLVATASAALAVIFSRVGGRRTSVLLAYPAAVTALFLPPVVAALYSPTLAQVVFPSSESLAIWLLDNLLVVGGVNDLLRQRFTLQGMGYVLMWFALAVPAGWFLGGLVALADLVRPTGEQRSTGSESY